MDDTEQDVRRVMTNELREACSTIKARASGTMTPAAIWKQFVRHGFLIDENIFQQWRAGRLVPLITSGAIGQAFFEADLATRTNGHFLVQPEAWRKFCTKKVTIPLGVENIKWSGGDKHDVIIVEESDEDDLKVHYFLRANSIVGKRRERDAQRKLRGLPPETDDEAAEVAPLTVTKEQIDAVLERAEQRVHRRDGTVRPGARRVTLPPPNVDIYWLPYASAPSTNYWPWKWGVTKEYLKATIRMASRWSTDYKDYITDIGDMAATSWLYRDPVPPHVSAKFRAMVERNQEKEFRNAMVKTMAWRLKTTEYPPNYEEFDYVMNYVKKKTQAMVDRDMPMDIPLSTLTHWFDLAKMQYGDEQ